jgi:hypothetical protein
MVSPNSRCHRSQLGGQREQHLGTDDRMPLNLVNLVRRQPTFLREDRRGDSELTQVVHHPSVSDEEAIRTAQIELRREQPSKHTYTSGVSTCQSVV